MSDNEIEDVSFLPGESLHRKAVYEPSIIQRVKLFACSRGRLAVIVTITCLVILVFALLIAISTNKNDVKTYPHYPGVLPTAKPTKPSEDYISTSGKPFPYRAIRLPDSIIPTHYSIFLHPNITESYFKGSVEISCDVKQTASYIVFHIKDLNITSLTLTLTDSTNAHVYNIKEYLEYKKNEQVYVSLGERLTPGSKVVLKVSFEGQLISKLAGFYKSMYKTNAGEKRYIATTHFEPTDARAAFPCFDEPALKATFELTMIRDKNYYSLFNMPLLSSSGYHDNLVQDKFQTSVKMSTYLVAFIVCDYESITNKTKRNVTVGVHAPKDSIGAAEFALSAAVKIIDYYEEYFGVEYPLPKQDLVAIPDFAAGAMENWGLITYRMTAILYDPKVSSAHYQQWVAVVIAHELAHQWFGNLVTMAWWDDLWLNEGFASYVEYIGSTQVNPGWKMEDQFVIDTQLRAEYLDCMKNSHPINLPVENPNQINELFDSITYDKGASIIRMLSQYLGEETFKAGLTSYLNRYRYNNAVTNDLWDSLSEASSHTASKSDHGTAVQSLMKTWTEQMGYPLITMERKGNTVTMTQSRFLLDTTSNTTEKYPSPFGYMWEVPFAYRTSKSPNNVQKILLKDKTGSFQLEEGTGWVQGNAEMYGYYRVNYDSSGWEAIIKELNRYPKTFSTTERAGLIDDAFMLARAGQLPYATVFTMLEYMVHEEDYLPWYSLMSNIVYVQRRLEEKPVYTQYKSYLLKLMKSQLDQVVWEDTGTHLQKYLRSQILSKAMDLGDKESIDKGRELFKNWKSDHTKINVNLKSVIYLAGIRYGDEADWTTVWQAYQVENDASEKRALLGALGQTRDTGLIMRLLSYSIDDNLVRSQDTEGVVSSVAGTPAGQVLSWRFLQQNWDLFHKRYAGTSFIMNRLIKSTCSRFDTQFDYNEVENFFAIRDAGSGTMAVQQTLESIHMNIDWSTRYEKEVTDWLQKHGQ